MFVNLSRRSQALVERQLDIIDGLEHSEHDPDRLSSLFRLDHLATRMRRNSENLLVLAGHEDPRKWARPVALVDVLRAAISEIEQFERIALNVQPGIVVAGRAASDVVHLAAELIENAASFSSENTRVIVMGQLLASGGALIEVTDEGLGISEQDLEYANWRLERPPVIDVGASRRMGLFVVGRLAARHGIRVRLRQVPGGGLSALVWVPAPVADFQPALPLPGPPKQPETGNFHPFFRPGHRPLTSTGPSSAAPSSTAPSSTAPSSAINSTQSNKIQLNKDQVHDGTSSGTSSSTVPPSPVQATGEPLSALSPAIGEAAGAGSPQTAVELPRRVSGATLPAGPPAISAEPGRGTGPTTANVAGLTSGVVPLPVRAPRRPAEGARSRLADLQRGARQGRAEAPWNHGAEEG
jgi:hypothetical protein